MSERVTFDPWVRRTCATIGELDERDELRIQANEFSDYVDRLSANGYRDGKRMSSVGELILSDTRFRYYDGERRIGLPCGEYADFAVLQSLKRFVMQYDKGFSTAAEQHSDHSKRQIPRDSLNRFLDMNVFNGTNVKNIVQSGKSMLYYQMTFLLPNCMRLYVLPGPRLGCFSAVLPLQSLCTMFAMNPSRPPPGVLVDVRSTRYAYLADSLRVKYAFFFPMNVSFLDRRDPVIHDGSVDTCDKLFLTDDEYSDFRVNCTLNCRNRNEDYDGDTNNPGFCKGIESATEIKYNMRTQLMSFLRNRHNFSQNVLHRAFVLLAFDDAYGEWCSRCVRRDRSCPVDEELACFVSELVPCLDVRTNPAARRRAIELFGPRFAPVYILYVTKNLALLDESLALAPADETASDRLFRYSSLWQPSRDTPFSNCHNLLDNVLRTVSIVYGSAMGTEMADTLLRTVHDRVPLVFGGREPYCLANVVNVLSLAKGTFDDIVSLQVSLEHRVALEGAVTGDDVPLALRDLLRPIDPDRLEHNKRYLDNFIYGSKRIPKNSKLAMSTKWTMQNVLYHEGQLITDDGVVIVEDLFPYMSYDWFMDVDVACAVLAEGHVDASPLS